MTPSQNELYTKIQTYKNWHKKPQYFIATLILCTSIVSYSQVGIGTEHPHPSAELEVNSSVRGFLLPRLTTEERHIIKNPSPGLQVYDSSTNTIWYFNSIKWVEIGGHTNPEFNTSHFNIENQFFYLMPKDQLKEPVAGLIRFDGSCFMLYDGADWVTLIYDNKKK